MATRRTIGKLAKEGGVSVETICFYERRGLLDEALATVHYFKIAQGLGFRLADILARCARLDEGDGWPIVAVGNEFRRCDWTMNLLRRFARLRGSQGSQWDPRIRLQGAAASAFVYPEFEEWLRRESVEEIALGGMFASAAA